MTTTASTATVDHEPGCSNRRLEAYEQNATRDGRARITRCLDCGATSIAWLKLPGPKPTQPVHQPHEDPRVERLHNLQLQHHLQRQRFLHQG